jgi:hypothetical protein
MQVDQAADRLDGPGESFVGFLVRKRRKGARPSEDDVQAHANASEVKRRADLRVAWLLVTLAVEQGVRGVRRASLPTRARAANLATRLVDRMGATERRDDAPGRQFGSKAMVCFVS